MWNEAEWADANEFSGQDWGLSNWQPSPTFASWSDSPISLSLERVDEVFDDLEALLQEALI